MLDAVKSMCFRKFRKFDGHKNFEDVKRSRII